MSDEYYYAYVSSYSNNDTRTVDVGRWDSKIDMIVSYMNKNLAIIFTEEISADEYIKIAEKMDRNIVEVVDRRNKE